MAQRPHVHGWRCFAECTASLCNVVASFLSMKDILSLEKVSCFFRKHLCASASFWAALYNIHFSVALHDWTADDEHAMRAHFIYRYKMQHEIRDYIDPERFKMRMVRVFAEMAGRAMSTASPLDSVENVNRSLVVSLQHMERTVQNWPEVYRYLSDFSARVRECGNPLYQEMRPYLHGSIVPQWPRLASRDESVPYDESDMPEITEHTFVLFGRRPSWIRFMLRTEMNDINYEFNCSLTAETDMQGICLWYLNRFKNHLTAAAKSLKLLLTHLGLEESIENEHALAQFLLDVFRKEMAEMEYYRSAMVFVGLEGVLAPKPNLLGWWLQLVNKKYRATWVNVPQHPDRGYYKEYE